MKRYPKVIWHRAVFQYKGKGRIHYRKVSFDAKRYHADPRGYLDAIEKSLGDGVTLIRVESVEDEG